MRARLNRLVEDSESGQAMVEFVLVFPVQLLLTLAILQLAFILHAHVVVGQAAFQGARAAAVSDMMPLNAQDSARRAAARTVGLLTPDGGLEGDLTTGGAALPDHARLRWKAAGGTYGYSERREREAYALLQPPRVHVDREAGYVGCALEFDYVMMVPVANRLFALATADNASVSQARGRTIFRIRRSGFVSTPWTVSLGGGP